MIALTIYRAEYYNSLNSGNCKISFGLIINPNKKHISILSFTSLYYNLCFQCLLASISVQIIQVFVLVPSPRHICLQVILAKMRLQNSFSTFPWRIFFVKHLYFIF